MKCQFTCLAVAALICASRAPTAIAQNPALGKSTADLIAMVKDQQRNGFDRQMAAIALGENRNQHAVVIPILIDVLGKDPDSGVREQASWALTCFPASDRTVGALVKALKDESPFVRRRAADYLGYFAAQPDPCPRTKEAVAALQRLLQAPMPPPGNYPDKWKNIGRENVLEAALAALSNFGPAAKDTLPAIRNLKDDPNIRVRRAARAALDDLAGGSARPPAKGAQLATPQQNEPAAEQRAGQLAELQKKNEQLQGKLRSLEDIEGSLRRGLARETQPQVRMQIQALITANTAEQVRVSRERYKVVQEMSQLRR
jgi:HEAT repeat protein